MWAVSRWLRRCRPRFDLVYVSMLKHDAYAAVSAARGGRFPVVLRAEGSGPTGDCHWQLQAPFGRRIKRQLFHADAFVAPSPAIERELFAAGYPRDRTHYLPNGVAVGSARNDAARREARTALAELNPALALGADVPLVVYTGRLDERKGLAHLVTAWAQVAARLPAARLWLVGEGPFHNALRQRIDGLGLAGRVVLAGAFDQVDELLSAANLFVLPSLEEGLSLSLLEAMALGLPVVATDIPGNRVVIENGQHGRLVPSEDAAALALGVCELLTQPELAARFGAAARERVRAEFSLTKLVQRHVELFRSLL